MILIIGGSGTLGKYLVNYLSKNNILYIAPTSTELDISSEISAYAFFKDKKKFKAIFILAAKTDVDLCEKDPCSAYKINAFGVKNIIQNIKYRNIPIIYVSTSGVFGGGLPKLRYCELDTASPLNIYGASKLYGEEFIKKYSDNYCIIRSSWMIGEGPQHDKKFISKILPALKLNKDVYAVHDKFGSLTYVKHLAEFLVTVYKKSYQDTIHFSSIDYTSRYEMVKYIAKIIKSKSSIIGVDSTTFPLPAPRAISEALYSVVNTIQTTFSWQEIIKDYLRSSL